MSDLISRQAAIDAMNAKLEDIKLRWRGKVKKGEIAMYLDMRGTIETLPSAQPEIIYCKDCVKHNKGHGHYYDGTIIGIKDCCPLVEIRGMAQGHEFDYQYCAYAERKTDVKADKGASC